MKRYIYLKRRNYVFIQKYSPENMSGHVIQNDRDLKYLKCMMAENERLSSLNFKL